MCIRDSLKAEVKENPDTFVYGKGANTADGVPDERFHFFSLREFRLFLKLILKFPVVDPCRTCLLYTSPAPVPPYGKG